VAGYGFTDAEQQAILHDNAAELLAPPGQALAGAATNSQ